MAAQTDANRVEIAGFGDDRNSAAAPGGGLLIDFFDQAAFNKLTRNFGYAGGASWLCSAIWIREIGPCWSIRR
ncbi:hypothetical protein CEW81_17575 [Kluyvera genomosp. 3]|uniref:Uncharacterized protein n=1 Tax=Kluyvera genomosp. 3 TaxID=2774055 RepID=A0A248KJZ3_9ENTR|nr:hypothetical protein CEW81_17575 [Kluyvera genomosp. 3]